MPDALAQAMVRRKTHIVGIIIPSFEVGYYAQMASVLEKTLNGLGYRALITQHLDDPQKEAEEIRILREYRVDGFILRNCGLDSDRDQIGKLAKAGIPFVLIDSAAEGLEDHFVGDDDYHGSALLVRHLLECGRKRIAYIGFHRSGDFRKSNRYKGYCRALEEYGMTIDHRYSEGCLSEYNNGRMELRKILERTRDDPVDAVFAVNDHTALNVILYLRELGYTPQKEILVAGYGGYMDQRFWPFTLPSIRQNVEKLGESAVSSLLSRMDSAGKLASGEHIGPIWIKGDLIR